MGSTNSAGKCPPAMKAASNGVFQGDNPLDYSLPLLIIQICTVVVITRGLAYLLRPLRQPRVIAEIAGGVLLGPSALGRNTAYLHTIFPAHSLTILDTIANLGLLFFLFLVGLELDLKSLRHTGHKALSVALAGITLPFLLGIGTSFLLHATISQDSPRVPFLLFTGIAFSITAFPVLARILAELRLLTTTVGRTAMSAAAVNDAAAWILLALAIALSGTGRSPLVSLWVFISAAGFIVGCVLVGLPVFDWMAKRCPEGEPLREIFVCATLTAVLGAGLVTDAIGIHALFGSFVLGVLVPKEGPFAGALVEKVEDLISSLFLPLYFVSSGLKTNVATIQGVRSWGLLVLVVFTACFGKIVGTIVVSLLAKLPVEEALTLGFLMNTKGLVELIVLNIGKDRGVLNDQTFAIMVLMALFTTFITTPIVMAIYKPAHIAHPESKDRTIQGRKPNARLCMLACFHNTRTIPTLINLMEISRGTGKKMGLRVYAMHLTELSEHSSTILMVQKARRNNGKPFWNKAKDSYSNQIVVAFETFEHLSQVSIRSMTAISHMFNMHEEICTSAENKRVSLIILPFHKHQRLDGHLETTRSELRHVNRRVLEHAPCSVGILVDRGLGGTAHVSASQVDYTITTLFFGGPDDREALSYGALMAEHPGIRLTVVQFVLDQVGAGPTGGSVGVDIDHSQEDGEFISEFRRNASEDGSIEFDERVVADGDEAVDVIRSLGRCNLYLVGRVPVGQLAAGLGRRSEGLECPELGPVGNLMISPEFATMASVLVVQQQREQLTGKMLRG